MNVKDKVVVVTGGARGIGEALCRRFTLEGAKVVVSDIDEHGSQALATELGGLGVRADVSDESDVVELIRVTEKAFGPVDLLCSNAGIMTADVPNFWATAAPNDVWQRSWDINVMGHINTARAVLPGMIDRKKGYILITASAAGLLSQIGSAPYSVTKHAAIGFAEALSIAHGDDGITVSALCPQAVNTDMLGGRTDGAESVDGIMEPSEIADHVIEGLAAEKFLILPHKTVIKYMERKFTDYDRWLAGMRRFRQTVAKSLESFVK